MGRLSLASACLGLCFFQIGQLWTASNAVAYTRTISPSGAQVRWPGVPKLNLAGNPINQSGISDNEFYAAVVRGLQRWDAGSGHSVGFDYWQGTNPDVYLPNSEYNGLSSIYFASNAKGDTRLSANVLGLTQVWYNTDTGEILETDIVLNDRDFRFTTDVRDTSGYGSGGTSLSGTHSNVFIENVITHELGHAFGLSHAGGLQSTMLFMESPEQAHLSCDDLTAIHAIYPGQDSGSRGSMSGSIVSESGSPIFGAHVLAISRRRGTVLATALSDKSGKFTISALEPGEYALMAEPFLAGTQVLPAYYGGMNYNVCPGTSGKQAFSRSFLQDSAGTLLQMLTVSAGRITSAPGLTVHCTSSSGASIASTARLSMEPLVYDGAASGDAGGFAIADRIDSTARLSYRLRSVSGSLELHAIAYSVYSPVHASITLFDSYGREVTTRTSDRVYIGDSGYVNYDSSLVADGLKPDDYVVRIDGSNLNAALYPAGPIMLDSAPFVVVTGSINEPAPAFAAQLPTNARCRMPEDFAAYSSPAGAPPRANINKDKDGVGFCGTLGRQGSGDDSSDGPGLGAVAGWFLPWLVMLAMARLMGRLLRRSQLAPLARRS